MSKKHYRAIAAEINSVMRESDEAERRGIIHAVNAMARVLKSDNNAFNRETFFAACFDNLESVGE